MEEPNVPTTKHELANEAYLEGNYQRAISLQVSIVNEHLKSGDRAIVDRKLLALYLHADGEYAGAIRLLKALAKEVPDDAEVFENIGVMLRQTGDISESVEYLLKAHEMNPEKPNICDGLAHGLHILDNPDRSAKYGRLSLGLKDAAADPSAAYDIPNGAPPSFNHHNRERNIISFSLFGTDTRYLHGAIRNAKLAPDLYPGWTCRFYCDPQVPKAIIKQLEDLNCQIVKKPVPHQFYDGLLWRFEVIDDPAVDRFLVRDCDSVINIKERVAVDEWLQSDKWFHTMRDFPSHTELILAGMWGGVSGVLPPLADLLEAFEPGTAATRTFDQHLLRNMVWPTVRKSVLTHDSVYTGCLGSQPFPSIGQLPLNRHIGQNEAAFVDTAKALTTETGKASHVERFFILGMLGSGKAYLQPLLDSHREILCPPEHQLSAIWKHSAKFAQNYQKVLDESGSRNQNEVDLIDEEKIGADLYETWLEHLFIDYADKEISHVGLSDHNLDSHLDYHSDLLPFARYIYIARDPRDVAVAVWQYKKNNDPGFDRDGSQMESISQRIGKEWSSKLRNVQTFNESHPGAIELVRYEDLVSPKTRMKTLTRLLTFLDLPVKGTVLDSMFSSVDHIEQAMVEVGAWDDALSMKQIDSIQKDANKLMTMLRYEICEVDYRAIEAGDTILPS